MAYRRRQGISRASTFKEEIYRKPSDDFNNNDTPSSSLAAQAIRASAAHRDSSLSSAYADSAFHRDPDRIPPKVFESYESASTKNESRNGFWGVLAKKAKEILEVEESTQQFESPGMTRPQMLNESTGGQFQQPYQTTDGLRKTENPRFRKGLDAITSSLNQIGDTFEKAFEEGRTIVENKTADIIQETRKLQIRKKGSSSEPQNQAPGVNGLWQQPFPTHPESQRNQETQLKASRDVAMATAAKAKLLLRELKTVKADLAFAKERCSQLEEENKILRESHAKGDNPADDDLIRLQLETLLAEKARLANENSVYARENRFLREIVEYHQLTMQDVVYLDEGIEEVTEVYPISFPGVSGILSASPTSPTSPQSPRLPEISPPTNQQLGEDEILPVPDLSQENKEKPDIEVPKDLITSTPVTEKSERHSTSSS